MEQVLLNLCLNARMPCPPAENCRSPSSPWCSTPPPPRGQLCQRSRTVRAASTVSDTGHGMTADVLERVFEARFLDQAARQGLRPGFWRWSYGIIRSARAGTFPPRSEPGRGRNLSCCYRSRPASGPDEKTLRRVSSRRPEFHRGHVSARGRPARRSAGSAEKVLTRLGCTGIAVAMGQQAVDRFGHRSGDNSTCSSSTSYAGTQRFRSRRALPFTSPGHSGVVASGHAAESLAPRPN